MQTKPRTFCLPIALLWLACSACSSADSLLPQDTTPPTVVPTTPAAPDAPVAAPAIASLPAAQIVRRLALDLTQRLPPASDAAAIAANSGSAAAVVKGYLNDRAAAQALASLHGRMWHFDSRALPDLDGFVLAGDLTLSAALTQATRLQIAAEPQLAVRYVLEQRLAWHRLYTSASILAPQALLPLWQATDLGAVFPTEPTRFGTAFGIATRAGLLVDPGFLANFDSHHDTFLRQRTANVFKELLCLAPPTIDAHSFTALTPAELAGDLNALALQKKTCAGCHSLWDGASMAFSGYASGTSFAAWLKATPPATFPTGLYAATSFQGLPGLAKLVGSDPRLQRCEILRLFEELTQRSYNDADQATLALALETFYAEGESLTAAARVIASADDFIVAPLPATIKTPIKRAKSGVKFLAKAHWEALMAQLLPQNTLVFSDDLDPGHDETFTQNDHLPSGAYWHAVDRLARLAASALVSAELADQALATNRHLLTTLPDGAAAGAGAGVAAQQMQDLWLTLTGVQLTAKDQIFLDLQTLWSQTAPGATADESRRAWRTVLTAVFSHPAFITY